MCWDEFQRVVNMTSQELAAWLKVSDADEESQPLRHYDEGTATMFGEDVELGLQRDVRLGLDRVHDFSAAGNTGSGSGWRGHLPAGGTAGLAWAYVVDARGRQVPHRAYTGPG